MYPNFLTDVFTPRVSSSADYAYTTEAQYTQRSLVLQAGYDYVGPGYASLALASNSPDRKAARLGMRYRIRSSMLRLNYRRQTNNLIGQKASTTVRNQLTGGASLRLSPIWTMNLNAALITMNNHLSDSLSSVDNSNYLFRISQLVRARGLFQSVQFDYAFQGTTEKNPTRRESELKSHEITVRTSVKASSRLTVTPSTSVITARHGIDNWNSTLTLGLGALWSDLISRRSVSAQFSYTGVSGTKLFRMDLRGDYRILPRVTGRIQLLSSFGRTSGHTENYDEYSGRLTVAYQFGE